MAKEIPYKIYLEENENPVVQCACGHEEKACTNSESGYVTACDTGRAVPYLLYRTCKVICNLANRIIYIYIIHI